MTKLEEGVVKLIKMAFNAKYPEFFETTTSILINHAGYTEEQAKDLLRKVVWECYQERKETLC